VRVNPTHHPKDAPFIAHVKALVKQHGSVARAWAAYRESFEYFDGEVEIEAFYKERFHAAARSK
jgi:hypothetical protein